MITLAPSSDGPAQPVAASRVESWIEEINEAVECSTGCIVKAGELLIRAKADLPHGQWGSMFENGKLSFSLRTAEILIQIARHATLRDPKYSSHLPQSWSVLHVLAKLPGEIIEREIGAGAIRADLKLVEARALIRRAQANGEIARPAQIAKAFDLGRQRTRLLEYFHNQAERWPSAYRAELAALLEAMALELRNR